MEISCKLVPMQAFTLDFQRSACKEKARLFPDSDSRAVDPRAVRAIEANVIGLASSDSPAIADDDVCATADEILEFTEEQRNTAFTIARQHGVRVTRSATKSLAAEDSLPEDQVCHDIYLIQLKHHWRCLSSPLGQPISCL